MSKGITKDNLLNVLPGVLKRDKGMYQLAQLIGWIIDKDSGGVNSPAVFQNIDTMPEDLLDILAADCKIDWYRYDADIETKRRQIKTNWKVRKQIGTKGAVETALKSIWPYSYVEEWYEYDGEPGYFHIVFDLTIPSTLPLSDALKIVGMFKPVRAHLDGPPTIIIKCGIKIRTDSENHIYHVPKTGTIPRYATHADEDGRGIEVSANTGIAGYTVRKCGTSSGELF